MKEVMDLYDRIVNPKLYVRRVTITANHVLSESVALEENCYEQMNLFSTYDDVMEQENNRELEREKKMQKAVLSIKKKYGKNAILKGMNLQEGATTMERNNQIGGHRA